MSAACATARRSEVPDLHETALDAAYQRVVERNRFVRVEVQDRHRNGLPEREHLDPWERDRLDVLREAADALVALRRRWHHR